MDAGDADAQTTVAALRSLMRQFVRERDWERFHSPKNLTMALAREAGELMEPFQWLDAAGCEALLKDAPRREAVEDELADVLLYALAFANAANMDVSAAVMRKLEKNAAKYPISRAYGRATKYNEL